VNCGGTRSICSNARRWSPNCEKLLNLGDASAAVHLPDREAIEEAMRNSLARSELEYVGDALATTTGLAAPSVARYIIAIRNLTEVSRGGVVAPGADEPLNEGYPPHNEGYPRTSDGPPMPRSGRTWTPWS
jgi:hypothetical protein